jgi:hypothetical protein
MRRCFLTGLKHWLSGAAIKNPGVGGINGYTMSNIAQTAQIYRRRVRLVRNVSKAVDSKES